MHSATGLTGDRWRLAWGPVGFDFVSPKFHLRRIKRVCGENSDRESFALKVNKIGGVARLYIYPWQGDKISCDKINRSEINKRGDAFVPDASAQFPP